MHPSSTMNPQSARARLQGVMTALVTPMRDGQVDYEALTRLVDAVAVHVGKLGVAGRQCGVEVGVGRCRLARLVQQLIEFEIAGRRLVVGVGLHRDGAGHAGDGAGGEDVHESHRSVLLSGVCDGVDR